MHLVSVAVAGVPKSSVTMPASMPRVKWLYGFFSLEDKLHSNESSTLMVNWGGLTVESESII